MTETRPPLIVIGHKNPDTDSICSAIAYAGFKRRIADRDAVAYRAGNINEQTQFALSRFGVEGPQLLTNVYPKISDIMTPGEKCIVLRDGDSLDSAARILTGSKFSYLPVIDASGRCVGRLTANRMVGMLREIAGRAEGGTAPAGGLLDQPIREFVERTHIVFHPADLVRDARREISRRNEGGFVVADEDGSFRGVVTRVNFLNDNARARVVLVDHNELSQAVDGADQADIVEIIDHHRLGHLTTSVPITFMNRTVGSTATIIADLYRKAGTDPACQHAGLLLAGLLSDTALLRSPTTTDLDRSMAEWLSGLCGEDAAQFGQKMLEAGAALDGKVPSQIVGQDRKRYEEAGRRFSVSQLETVDFSVVLEERKALMDELARLCDREDLAFACLMVTDVTRETSLLLMSGGRQILGAISYPRREEGVYEMKGVLSRKKQVLPYLIDMLRKL